MGILTDSDRVQFGLTLCAAWSGHLDHVVRTALRRLVPHDSVAAAVGHYGHQDGCDGMTPSVLLCGHPQHVQVMMDELRQAIPDATIFVDTPAPMMRAHVLDARPVWGSGPLPPAPFGDTFAHEWAPLQLEALNARKMTGPAAALDDWAIIRRICAMAGVKLPALLDLPKSLADLYTARNMGMERVPQPVFDAYLGDMLRVGLNSLAQGAPVLHTAIQLRGCLFE